MIGIAMIDIRFSRGWPGRVISWRWGCWWWCARYGHIGKGAQRWIEFGGMQIQPSELMKIALVLALARGSTGRRGSGSAIRCS